MKENFIWETNPPFDTRFAVGDCGLNPDTIVINCEKIIIAQKSVGIEIEATRNILDKADTIIVNGIEFVKKVDKENNYD